MSICEAELPCEVTKQSIRKKIWDHLEKENLAFFPRPVHGRIPNFKGSVEAARCLEKLHFFSSATSVKVNPDKPQQEVRFLALQAKKKLFVPVPRLHEGFLTHVELPVGDTNASLKVASTRSGIEQWGKPVGLDANVKIDLVVLGSVAVSKEGYRIGKGEGYADLEFALMMKMGAVNQDTIVATTVHDCQVVDLPHQLFKEHDVPVDFIITPTKVIEVPDRLPKPTGIIWNLLSNRRLSKIPILQVLRDRELQKGVDCTLKEDSDIEEGSINQRNVKPRPKKLRSRGRKMSSQEEINETSGEVAESIELKSRPTRTFRHQRNVVKAQGEGGGDCKLENDKNTGNPKKVLYSRRPFRGRPSNSHPGTLIDMSLRVANISPDVRVRDLKSALLDCGVKPVAITWRGRSGFALLHFTKLNNEETGAPMGLDSLISQLKELKIASNVSGDEGSMLKIEPVYPVSRIEVTDISSV